MSTQAPQNSTNNPFSDYMIGVRDRFMLLSRRNKAILIISIINVAAIWFIVVWPALEGIYNYRIPGIIWHGGWLVVFIAIMNWRRKSLRKNRLEVMFFIEFPHIFKEVFDISPNKAKDPA